MFILDSDHLSILQYSEGADYARLAKAIAAHAPDSFFVTIVSFHEQVNGWNAYINKNRSAESIVRGYQKFELLLANFARAQVLSFSDVAAEIFDELIHQKIRAGTMDLRIASIAIANQMTLLSRNTVDFERVPGLSLQDWLAVGQ